LLRAIRHARDHLREGRTVDAGGADEFGLGQTLAGRDRRQHGDLPQGRSVRPEGQRKALGGGLLGPVQQMARRTVEIERGGRRRLFVLFIHADTPPSVVPPSDNTAM
jgi:hypothetical protein